MATLISVVGQFQPSLHGSSSVQGGRALVAEAAPPLSVDD
jgi:hypothetical protein